MLERLAILLLATGCAHSTVEMRLQHDSEAERRTRDQLRSLVQRYDLSPWQYTSTVLIDETSIPHSHPVLTLHTRHLRDDLLLLSTYIHEQSHWMIAQHAGTSSAVAELERLFPELPVGHPEGGFDRRSSYEHLIVNTLEHLGLIATVGELAALQAMHFWSTDHYRTLYRLVLDERTRIREVLGKHGLTQPGAATE
jgi:hypothetical protein